MFESHFIMLMRLHGWTSTVHFSWIISQCWKNFTKSLTIPSNSFALLTLRHTFPSMVINRQSWHIYQIFFTSSTCNLS
jgi:hypothetical protein